MKWTIQMKRMSKNIEVRNSLEKKLWSNKKPKWMNVAQGKTNM